MSDIVDRLNTLSDIIMMGEKIAWGSDSAIMREAAAEIEKLRVTLAEAEKKAERDYLRFVDADREEIKRLREENARLREVLKPFAPDSQWIDPAIHDGRPIYAMFLAGELRAAAAAIREGEKNENQLVFY